MISIEQFQSWLAGVEDMQDDGWVPSASQWQKIRSKINEIESPIQLPVSIGQYPQPTTPYQHPRGQVVPLMEPAPYPINVPMYPDYQQTPSQSVMDPVPNVSPNADGSYRSGFI